MDSRAGKLTEAAQRAQATLEVLPPGREPLQGLLCMQLGYARLRQVALPEARATLAQASALLLAQNNPYGYLTTLAYHARAERSGGNWAAAQKLVARGLSHAREQKLSSSGAVGSLLLEEAELRVQRGDIEVLDRAAQGLSNRQIGERLFVSVGTVKTHLHLILGKLNVRNRTGAVAKARQLGLLV